VSDNSYRTYILAELRCARARAKLLINEIDRIGLALKDGMIEPLCAIEWLNDANGLGFLIEDREEPLSACLISINEAAAAQLS
jgi:hypothetical protein